MLYRQDEVEAICSVESMDDSNDGPRNQLKASELKDLLHELWSKEKDVLCHIFSVFTAKIHKLLYPTDIFFKQIQVVPPSRFRQV